MPPDSFIVDDLIRRNRHQIEAQAEMYLRESGRAAKVYAFLCIRFSLFYTQKLFE